MKEQVPRLFVALEIAEPLAAALDSAREQLHVTLHFLGERDLDTVAALLEAVRSPPFDLIVTGFDVLEGRDGARVLVARVDGGEALTALHQDVARVLSATGYTPEARPYRPHVTLRYGKPTPEAIAAFLARTPPVGPMRVTSFSLFASRFEAGSPTYTRLRTYPLAGLGTPNGPGAAVTLGAQLLYGSGRPKDEALGLALIEQAHALGLTSATSCLADAYRRGLGVAVDKPRALALLELAADRGHAYCAIQAARMHRDADGVPGDPARARHYFELFLQLGADGEEGTPEWDEARSYL